MTRLSTNPATILRQIVHCNNVLVEYKSQLEQVPMEDSHGRTSLKRALLLEKAHEGKLIRHLLGLEEEFDGLLENAPSPTLQFEES